MKYCLVLLFGLSYVAQSFSQSSLYQNSAQRVLDEQRNFLEEHLFSTSFYEHSRLLTNPLPSPLQEEAALGRAISSLQLADALTRTITSGSDLIRLLPPADHASPNTETINSKHVSNRLIR